MKSAPPNRQSRRFLSPLPLDHLAERMAARNAARTGAVRINIRGERLAAFARSDITTLGGPVAVFIGKLKPTPTGGTLIEGEQRPGAAPGTAAFAGFGAVLVVISVLVALLAAAADFGLPDLTASVWTSWTSNLAMGIALAIGAPVGWRHGRRKVADALDSDLIGAAMREAFEADELA